ncbi:CAP domain-containing protein [Oscillochloris sp. ZM17-4]|uniref:CAP domain-containing protein n=1 Tax=Oscillochloris sp. ZM17-4 TaxID=2866714 RepID=UPI001C73AFD1|nr:CAP domain-containing protein [Oscillochloris sp. ZM17-4]MBX0330266.1 CAP domain-containing protein [Oscillochloris sp. ZM17-4]
MNHRTLFTLSALVALVVLTSLGLRARAAELNATQKVYLPLVVCPTCTGSAGSVTPTPVTPTPVTPTPVTPTPTPSQDAAEVIRLVNIERAKVGCPAVVAEAHVMAGVQAWAEYMWANNYYQHAMMDWYAPYGYPTGVMENIGGGGAPAQIVDQWLSSHMGHRENLLWCYPTDDPSYDPNRVYVAGVGHAGTYWVWGLVDLLPEDIPTGPLP